MACPYGKTEVFLANRGEIEYTGSCEVIFMVKTNAMRLLTQAKVPYDIKEYEVDENDLNGMHAAQGVGMDPETVFKTLVARGEKVGYLVFCIPVCRELDLKKAAKVAGCKKVEMIAVKELLPLTGYIRGGCSPVGMKKKFPTYLEETAQLCDTIAVSAGVRGVQLIVNPEDLATYVDGTFADIAL